MRAITLALGLLAAAQVAVANGQTTAASAADPQETLISRFLNEMVNGRPVTMPDPALVQ